MSSTNGSLFDEAERDNSMIYAKQITGGKLTALLTYDYEPEFGEDSDTVIITEEEYNALMEELKAAQTAPDPDAISDAQALSIIFGEDV